jgi:hypothetical protein
MQYVFLFHLDTLFLGGMTQCRRDVNQGGVPPSFKSYKLYLAFWHSEGLDFVNVWRRTLNSKRVEK